MRRVTLTWLLCLSCLMPPAFAEDAETAPAPQVQYVELRPSFVTNFGTPGNKLRYIKADVSLRVSSAEAAAAVEKHMPLIRHQVVLLLSKQDENAIMDISTQEAIRQDALTRVKKVLKEEENQEFVDDLLFTNFVTQQ